MPQKRRVLRIVVLAAISLASVLAPGVAAAYLDDESTTAAYPSPTGTASATSSADKVTGVISVSTNTRENLLPVGGFAEHLNQGIGASRAIATALIKEEFNVSTGGSNIVTVQIDSIVASAATTSNSPLALLASAVNAQVSAFFHPCPVSEPCSVNPSGSSSTGLVPVVHTAIPQPGGPPTSLTLKTTITASGPGIVKIEAGFFGRSDTAGAGNAQSAGSADITSITLVSSPPPTTTLYDDAITERTVYASPTGNAGAAASADRATGALNVSTQAFETVLPAGVFVDHANTGVGASRGIAVGRVVSDDDVTASGTYTVTIQIGGINGTSSKKLLTPASTAASGVWATAKVLFFPCPAGPPCQTTPTVDAGSVTKPIINTNLSGVPTSVTLTKSISVPGTGFIRTDVGFYGRSDATGWAITGVQAAGTVQSVTIT